MSTLGKVLIFFNLIAAGAFGYFAMQSYYGEKGQGNGRQAITAAALRHILLVDGLPLGANPGDPSDMPGGADPDGQIPFKVMMAGSFQTDFVSKKLLETYFKPATGGEMFGGGAVPNQLAEVKRVKGKIDAALTAAEKPEEKLTLLQGWLLLQAETYEEREAIQKLLAAKTPDAIEKLQKMLDEKFVAVIEAPKPVDLAFTQDVPPNLTPLTEDVIKANEDLRKLNSDLQKILLTSAATDVERKTLADQEKAKQAEIAEGLMKLKEAESKLKEAQSKVQERIEKVDVTRGAPLDDSERRARVAHLLVHLNLDPDWQKRVAMIVGMRKFATAIINQAERFMVMAERIKLIMPVQQADFQSHERILLRLAIDRTDLANTQAELKAKWVDQEKKEADFAAQRETQLKAIQARYAKIKIEVDEMLVKQASIEQALFEVQREVAVTLDEVYRLEGVLEARERDLLGLPPRPKVAGGN
ncbi:MAG: hypothetical protein K8U57_19210 [Planctomycetes bacterium]|nr:hypothetical protein [Planctomycetota bacterium]